MVAIAHSILSFWGFFLFKSMGVAFYDNESRVEQAGYEMLSSLAPISSETKAQLPGLQRFN